MRKASLLGVVLLIFGLMVGRLISEQGTPAGPEAELPAAAVPAVSLLLLPADSPPKEAGQGQFASFGADALQLESRQSGAGLGQPLQPQESQAKRPQVPILMYHEIGSSAGPWQDLYVEPKVFAGQLDWLQENGYTTVSLKQVYEHWQGQAFLPEKPLVLTFDDGYPSVYQTVWPLLRERGMRATFFIYPAKLDTSRGLSSAMVAELAGAGMEIGSHTYNHLDLTKFSAADLEHQLAGSRIALELISGVLVEFLAYPAGSFNPGVAAAVEAYGYLGAVTTRNGPATPQQSPYEWQRVRVNGSDEVEGLARKLGG